MYLLIHDYCGHPFQFDLSNELAHRGHRVWHVYTSASGGPKAGFDSDHENLSVIDIAHSTVQKQQFVKRWFQERQYGDKAAAVIREKKPDLVLSSNTPLEAQRKLLSVCHELQIPFVYWLQDLISVAVQRLLQKRLGVAGRLAGLYFSSVERSLLSQSAHVIAIADEFQETLNGWGIPQSKVSVIPNWAPLGDIPVHDKVNSFSKNYDIADKFTILYAGTLGMKHDPSVIVQAVQELEKESDIQFVVASDGYGMEFLQRAKKSHGLDNVLLLPLQFFEIFPLVLASADVLLVLLEQDAGVFSVPSKVWSGYCSARPSLLVVPKENIAARITKQIQAGVVITPDQKQQLAKGILELKKNPKKRAQMGCNARRYAEQHFDIQNITDQFEEIFYRYGDSR